MATKKTKTTKTAKAATQAKTGPQSKNAKAVAKKEKPAAKLSQIAAAERVLEQTGQPMNCQQMVDAMTKAGLWTSPNGKTPAATLYASLLRAIKADGKNGRFKKVARGQFALAAK